MGRIIGFTLVSVLVALICTVMGRTVGAQEIPPRITALPVLEAPDSALVELGKMLFFDTRLSGDGSTSCATCHDPQKGWTDELPLSKAFTGALYFRNTKTILNAVYARYFYWDGRLTGNDLETQVRDAITETHFMNADGRIMLERLKQVPRYVEMFRKALGGEPSFGRTLKSIAAFEKTVVSKNVPFDRNDLTTEARRGWDLFQGKAGCIRCHNGPYFSDGQAYSLGVPENPDIFRDPLRHITFRSVVKFLGVPNYMNLRRDVGFYAVTKDQKDVGAFLTPTLREVARTGPYMHNGTLITLESVVDFYNGGGKDGPNKTPLLGPLGLTAPEKQALVEFLRSLSGDPVVVQPPKLPDYGLIQNWRQVEN